MAKYKIEVCCSSCGKIVHIELLEGTKIEEDYIQPICPECGEYVK